MTVAIDAQRTVPGPRAGSRRRMWALYKRHAYELRHSIPGLVDMLFWPAMDLLLWGLLTRYMVLSQVHIPQAFGFLIGGVLLWDFVFRSNLGIGITFLDDTSWTQNILNLMVSPLRPSEYIAAAAAWSMTKVLVGWSLMVFFALALMTFGTAVGMIVLGIILRFGPGADILAWGLAVILMPISAVFYPVSALPGWAQALASALPTSHIFEAMRTVIAGRPVPWNALYAAFALDALYLTLGLMFANAMFGLLKKRGYITRYMT
jgi:ABC-2 type transport system permease protein